MKPLALPGLVAASLLTAAFGMSTDALAESKHKGEIVFYEEGGERGHSFAASGAHDDLSGSGFDNKARSLRVHEGVWQVCSEPHYRGSCRNYDPGPHELNSQLSGKVSSFRKGGPIASEHHHVRQTGDDVILYSGHNGQGQSYGLKRDRASLSNVGFNDVARSLRVRSGTWQFCQQSDYRGFCESYGPGLHQLGFLLYRQISSLRRTHGGGGGNGGHHGGHHGEDNGSRTVVVYGGNDGHGAHFASNHSQANLRADGFADRARSVRVRHGTWRFCRGENYSGTCQDLGIGLHNLAAPFDRAIKSFEPVSHSDRNPHRDHPSHHKGSNHPNHGYHKIVLYGGNHGEGHSYGLNERHSDLKRDHFNEHARSVRVNGGVWLLCNRANYQGHCRTFGKGLHTLGEGLRGHVVSLREE
ncbi:MAG: hypothetical protein Kilf2KO_27380 [Rhodospirillales bacterium]